MFALQILLFPTSIMWGVPSVIILSNAEVLIEDHYIETYVYLANTAPFYSVILSIIFVRQMQFLFS